jgi:hypothetical protein
MKAIAKGNHLLKQPERKAAFIDNVQDITQKVFGTPIRDKLDIIDRMTKVFITPGENIVHQSILKGSFPRLSERKSIMHDSIKNQENVSSKIIIQNPNEKADVRFIPELLTASRYSKTSDSIKIITLNSEQADRTNMEAKIQTGNARPDINIKYEINKECIWVSRDIKSGNNMNNITKGILAEIPYTENGQLYQVINEPLTLAKINEQRDMLLKNKYEYTNLSIFITTIHNLDPILKYSEIMYNNAVQQQLYNIMAIDKTINFSFYYGIIVKERTINPEFFKRLEPHINNDIFNSKKHFNIFMSKAIIIYHNTVAPILSNVQNTKGTQWEVSFLDEISTTIFDDI